MEKKKNLKWKSIAAAFLCLALLFTGTLPFAGTSGGLLTARASGWVSWLWDDEEDEDSSALSGDKAGDPSEEETDITKIEVDEDGTYTSKLEVAAYIYQFGRLPSNFIRKNKAKKLGWVSSEGNLDEVAPGKSIGGDYFGNYEGLLPEKDGRDYYECDIDYTGGFRDAKRIIYSSDGLIYYTEDHYKTFEQLYGGE